MEKSIESYFNPKIKELELLKKYKRILGQFSGEVFINNNLGYEHLASYDFSLADKVEIIEKDNTARLYLYFKLDKELPIYCIDSDIRGIIKNVVYIKKSEEGRGCHYDAPTFVTISHSNTIKDMLNYYKKLGVKKSLLSKMKDKINLIRKESPEGVRRYW